MELLRAVRQQGAPIQDRARKVLARIRLFELDDEILDARCVLCELAEGRPLATGRGGAAGAAAGEVLGARLAWTGAAQWVTAQLARR